MMETYKKLYEKLCSIENLYLAFRKARKGKSKENYVIEFEKNLNENLLKLHKELNSLSYKPTPLKTFVIYDPKTRVIRKSIFKDRIVHHAVVNILEPIWEPIFIYDSYANRKGKGTTAALMRFDKFKRKISKNGVKINGATKSCMVKGFVLKMDVKRFFDSMNHGVLMRILSRKIKDYGVLWLVNKVLKNYDDKEKGLPLGNMTSQFFGNVYLNELDYFVKHRLIAKYYIRYVDDIVILHENGKILEVYKERIEKYIMNLKLELHKDKSKIISLYKGFNFLGFKVFYYQKLVRKRNLKYFMGNFEILKEHYRDGVIRVDYLIENLQGWFGYAMWGDSYKIRQFFVEELRNLVAGESAIKKRIDKLLKLN